MEEGTCAHDARVEMALTILRIEDCISGFVTCMCLLPNEASYWPCIGLWKPLQRSQGICSVSRAKAEQSRQAFKTWQVDIVLEQRLVCFSLLTTPGPGLSRDVSWPGHCGSPVFLAKDCGETWCGDRGETGLKGFVCICAKESLQLP